MDTSDENPENWREQIHIESIRQLASQYDDQLFLVRIASKTHSDVFDIFVGRLTSPYVQELDDGYRMAHKTKDPLGDPGRYGIPSPEMQYVMEIDETSEEKVFVPEFRNLHARENLLKCIVADSIDQLVDGTGKTIFPDYLFLIGNNAVHEYARIMDTPLRV